MMSIQRVHREAGGTAAVKRQGALRAHLWKLPLRSFCAKHGGVWTSCPTGSLEVTVREPSLVSRYAFGTKTAEFHICSRCGIVPVVTSRIAGKLHAVVSVNAFENVSPSLLRRASTTFDAENEETRLARRARNWIPSVAFVECGSEH